jgi:hypothetical protein
MKLYIKNMVCGRCENGLLNWKNGGSILSIQLGEGKSQLI